MSREDDLLRWKEYHKQYYSKHKERICGRQKERYKYDKFYRESTKAMNKSRKLEFLDMYGGKCECCKETIYEFLCLDHINGRNRKHKNETGNVAYKRAIENYDPKEYRILCANCNAATRLGHICPHKLEDI